MSTHEPPGDAAYEGRSLKTFDRLSRRAGDVGGALAVIAMVAHNHLGARALRDIGPDDEGWYLGSGLLLGKPGFPNGPNGWPIPEQGPMYSLWYFALSKVWRTPLDLYFASWQVLATVLSVALFLAMRRAGAPWWQALLATFFYVNSVVADVWPFPTYFATLLVLAGVLAAARQRTTGGALSCVTSALAFAAFARPELLAGYATAVAAVCVHTAYEWRQTRDTTRATLALLVAVVPGALLFLVFGNPLGGMRSFYAFAQHYTLNLFAAQGSSLSPWAHWTEIVARDFPGTWTLGQAIRKNPFAFVAHVGRNIQTFPDALLLVTDSLDASRRVQWVLVTVGGVFAAVQLRRARVVAKANVVCRALLFALACCTVPFVFSCLCIYPRQHYFVPVAVLLTAAAFASPLPIEKVVAWRPSPAQRTAICTALAVVLVLLTARKSAARSLDRQRTVLFLSALHLAEPAVVLEEAWGTCMYAGLSCTSYERYDKHLPFDAFVQRLGIEVLVIDETLPRDPHFEGDPEFEDFLRDPARHGFVLLDVPGTHVRVARRIPRGP